MEYLVKNHLYGNYYISDNSPVYIEAICQQCFDRDEIVAYWEKGNEDQMIEAIYPCCLNAAYLCIGSEMEEENFKNWLIESGYEEFNSYLEEDIIDSFEAAKDVIKYLGENYKQVSFNVIEEITELIENKKVKWEDISKKFNYFSLKEKVLIK